MKISISYLYIFIYVSLLFFNNSTWVADEIIRQRLSCDSGLKLKLFVDIQRWSDSDSAKPQVVSLFLHFHRRLSLFLQAPINKASIYHVFSHSIFYASSSRRGAHSLLRGAARRRPAAAPAARQPLQREAQLRCALSTRSTLSLPRLCRQP